MITHTTPAEETPSFWSLLCCHLLGADSAGRAMGHPDRLRTVQDRQFVGGEDAGRACYRLRHLFDAADTDDRRQCQASGRQPRQHHLARSECARSGDSGQRCPPLVGARVLVLGLKRTVGGCWKGRFWSAGQLVAVVTTLEGGGVHPTVERGVASQEVQPVRRERSQRDRLTLHRHATGGLKVGVTLRVGSRGGWPVPRWSGSARAARQMVDTPQRAVRPSRTRPPNAERRDRGRRKTSVVREPRSGCTIVAWDARMWTPFGSTN